MRKPPRNKPPVLPNEVALEVANIARVPAKERESFCDLVQLPVRLVWERDRRALGTKAGSGLVRAAQAARTLDEAFGDLSPNDREWIERLWARTPEYKKWILELPRTINRLAHLFSIAAGMAPPLGPAETSRPSPIGRRPGTIKDMAFREFVRLLLVAAAESGGRLALDKNRGTGSLIEAIEMLAPYLPNGVVPKPLSPSTLQRIKTNRNYYTGFYDIDIFYVEQPSSPLDQ
jgi:hypothetical protein